MGKFLGAIWVALVGSWLGRRRSLGGLGYGNEGDVVYDMCKEQKEYL